MYVWKLCWIINHWTFLNFRLCWVQLIPFFFLANMFFFSEVEQNSWSMDGYVSYLTKLGWVIILLVPLKCSKVVRKTEFFMKTNEIENVVGGELKREETLWRIPPNQIFRLTKAKQDNYLFNTVHNLLNK